MGAVIGIIGLIFSVIVFCIFVGMFYRLGRIEQLLIVMAIHRGAITKEQAVELKTTNKVKSYSSGQEQKGARWYNE